MLEYDYNLNIDNLTILHKERKDARLNFFRAFEIKKAKENFK